MHQVADNVAALWFHMKRFVEGGLAKGLKGYLGGTGGRIRFGLEGFGGRGGDGGIVFGGELWGGLRRPMKRRLPPRIWLNDLVCRLIRI